VVARACNTQRRICFARIGGCPWAASQPRNSSGVKSSRAGRTGVGVSVVGSEIAAVMGSF
jgi:hypothetical protein